MRHIPGASIGSPEPDRHDRRHPEMSPACVASGSADVGWSHADDAKACAGPNEPGDHVSTHVRRSCRNAVTSCFLKNPPWNPPAATAIRDALRRKSCLYHASGGKHSEEGFAAPADTILRQGFASTCLLGSRQIRLILILQTAWGARQGSPCRDNHTSALRPVNPVSHFFGPHRPFASDCPAVSAGRPAASPGPASILTHPPRRPTARQQENALGSIIAHFTFFQQPFAWDCQTSTPVSRRDDRVTVIRPAISARPRSPPAPAETVHRRPPSLGSAAEDRPARS